MTPAQLSWMYLEQKRDKRASQPVPKPQPKPTLLDRLRGREQRTSTAKDAMQGRRKP